MKKQGKVNIRIVKKDSLIKNKVIVSFAGLSLLALLVYPALQVNAIAEVTWPTAWTYPTQCAEDPANDENPASIDLVGTASNQAVGFYSDSNFMYFRERVGSNPISGDKWDQKAWVVLFQTTKPNYQYLASLNGKDDKVQLYQNTSASGPVDFSPLLNDPAESLVHDSAALTFARSVSAGGGYYFVDWALPMSVLTSAGITAQSTQYFATSADANNFNKDHLNCYEVLTDLSVVKSGNTGPVDTGTYLTYTITVTNIGPDDAIGVSVVDVLGSNLTYDSSNTATGSYSSATNTWTIGSLAYNATATLSLTVKVGSGASGGSVTNTATVSSTTYDPNATNNSSTVTTTVNALPTTGTLVVKKVVVNDNDGDKVYSDFNFSVNGGDPVAFETDGINELTVEAGTYTVTEPAVDGYSAAYDNCTEVVVPVGDSATCTITNNDNMPPPPDMGVLTIVKNLVNNHGGTMTASDFSFSVNSGEPIAFEADGQNDLVVEAGVYSVVESTAEGYTTSYENCTEITVPKEGNATCIITNDDIAGILAVVKELTNNDNGTSAVTDFSFSINGGEPIVFEADGRNEIELVAGIYTVIETSAEGYNTSYDGCVEANITIGSYWTCTIANDDKPLVYEPTADLDVTKSVDDNTVDTNQQITFTITVTNNGPYTAENVTVNDTLPAGLEFVSASSDAYSSSTNIWTIGSLNNGQSAMLDIVAKVTASEGTITNTALANLDPDIDLNAQNNSASASVTVNYVTPPCTTNCGGGGGGGGGGSGNLINGVVFNDQNANGVQDPGEPGLPGWTVYFDANSNSTLDSGETYSNTDANGNYSFSGIMPGNYVVREQVQTGWEQTYPDAVTKGHAITVAFNTTALGFNFGNTQGQVLGTSITPPAPVVAGATLPRTGDAMSLTSIILAVFYGIKRARKED
jgi:uncharacterized repeat protein (TIGR01451 family)